MSYPVLAQSLNGTTMPRPAHQAGDWIVCFYTQKFGAVSTPTGSGWAELASTSNINSYIGKIYAKKATSSNETIPNAELSPGAEQVCTAIVIRGLHATTIVADSLTETDTGVAYTAPAVTPTADNQLVMHFNLGGVSGRHLVPLHGVTEIARKSNSQNHQSVVFRYGGLSGVAISEHPYVTNTDTANKFSQWFFSIAFVDDGTDQRAGVPDYDNPPAEMLHLLGFVGRSGHLNGASLSFDPTSYIPTVSNDNTAYSDTAVYDAVDTGESLIEGIAFASIENASSTSDVLIAGTDLEVSGGNKDLSGQIVSLTYAGLPRLSTNEVGSVFGFTDKTNTRLWQLDGANNYPNGSITPLTATIEVDGGYGIDDIGTFNSSSVSAVILGGEVNVGTTGQLTFGALNKLNTLVMSHGSITTDMRHVEKVSRTAMLNTVKNQFGQTDTQYTVAQSIRIECESWGGELKQAIAYPGAYNYDQLKTINKVSQGLLGFELKPPSGKTHNVSGWLFVMGNYHKWGVSYGALGTVIADGAFVTGCTPVLNASAVAIGGFTIADSKEVVYTVLADCSGGATFTGCVDAQQITITGNSAAALQLEVDKLDNCIFKNSTGIAVNIEYTGLTADIALTFTGMTLSGNTTDVNYQSTNVSTLTIIDDGSGILETNCTVSGAAVDVLVVAPSVGVTVTSNIAANIKIFANSTIQTTVAATTTDDTTLTYEGTGTFYYTVQKAGYLPIHKSITVGATSQTANEVLASDPIYTASHGLVWSAAPTPVAGEIHYDPATRLLYLGNTQQEGRDIYSALIDNFISQGALNNREFPIVAIGPDRFQFTSDGTTGAKIAGFVDNATPGHVAYWKGAGMDWEHDTTGLIASKFYFAKTSNTLQAGTVVGFTQTNNGTPVLANVVSNKLSHCIQFYEDTNGDGTPDFEYKTHLLFKGFKTGYYQARWDIINDGGATELEPYEYIFSLRQDAIAGATGDQGVTIATLTDHTAVPKVVGGKSFDYELVDPASTTASDLLSQYNYDVYTAVSTLISTAYLGYQAFDLPDLLVEVGSAYQSEIGLFEGDGLITDQSGVYISRGGGDHPDLAAYQSNDGSYYTPDVTANIGITGLPNAVGASRNLQILNLSALSSADWSGGLTVTEGSTILRSTGIGTEFTAGLFFRASNNGTTHATTEPTWNLTPGATTTDNGITWTCYKALFYDADPAATGYSASYIDGEEIKAGETYDIRFAEMDGTTSFKFGRSIGIAATSGFTVAMAVETDLVYAAWALLEGQDGAFFDATFSPDYILNYVVLDTNTDFSGKSLGLYYCYILTTSAGMHRFWGGVTLVDTGNLRNNDDVVDIYLDETAGFVLQTDNVRIYKKINPNTRPALDPTTGASGLEMVWRNQVFTNVVNTTGSPVITGDISDVPARVQSGMTAQGYTTARSVTIDTVATIDGKVDTINTSTAGLAGAAMRGTDGANTTAPDNASIAAVKAKTDQLTFTKANELDSNVQSMNGAEIVGDGSTGNKLRSINE